MLSKSCTYGLRAAVLLATKEKEVYVTIKELSDELDISFFFLTKVLQQLTKAELLESYKGPNGGVRLAKPSKDITMSQIIEVIDGGDTFKECALGLPGCGVLQPCPLHNQWSDIKEKMIQMLNEATLQELAQRNKRCNSQEAGTPGGSCFKGII